MNARKQRSKKQSGANSERQPDNIVLFLDRNLGNNIIAKALRKAGHQVEIHDDHLPLDAPDEDWIRLTSSRGWIGLTKDKQIRYRTAEISAIKEYGARVIVIRAKNQTGHELAEILVKYHSRIRNFAARECAPFIAGITRSGDVRRYDIEPVTPALIEPPDTLRNTL